VLKLSRTTEDGPTYELRFDGSCVPNPGGVAGYGWVLYLHDAEEHDGPAKVAEGCGPVSAPPGGVTTNNLAEWAALRAGLEWFRCLAVPVGRLLIRGDSLLVIEQLAGSMACKKPHLQVYRDACLAILRATSFAWEAAWVPRDENAVADALSARTGARK
jgi:ribonuclease HI